MSEAYNDGIEAAYRIGKYQNYTDIPDNPYSENSKEANDWNEGFGDGTEDFLRSQES